MVSNEEKGAVEKTEENVEMAKDAAQVAGKAATGDWAGAAKNALNLLKNGQFKKRLKMQIIKIIITLMLPIILGAFVLGVFNVVKDTLVGLIANAISIVAGFFEDAWQYITDGYWFDLDAKKDYVIDGQTLSLSVVDKYLYELGNQGISLEELRLLGEADYSNPNILADENNKALAEKYIAEFIRADVITQQPHRRRGSELVNTTNQNLIDGGIYVYRTKKEPTINEDDFKNGDYIQENVTVTEHDYEPMEYISPQDFLSELGISGNISDIVNNKSEISNLSNVKINNLRYKYTIDESTGKMIFIEIITTTSAGAAVEKNGWFDGIEEWWQSGITKTTNYKVRLIGVEYKNLISKYSMPYEFLINLCQITQNPEFVYHVALLARNTKIELVVQDNVVVERSTTEMETDKGYYVNGNNNKVSEATCSNIETTKRRDVSVSITQTPVLNIERADTWSFYEEFIYTKNLQGSLIEDDIAVQPKQKPETLKSYNDPQIVMGYEIPGYWYDNLVEEMRRTTQTVSSITTYNQSVLKGGSTEKSSQFLGLLRNSTGKCSCSNCYEQGVNLTKKVPNAMLCINSAQFNKNGINVQYRIPGMTRTEAPLSKLVSGIDMLYEILQTGFSDSNQDKLKDPVENDYNSIYVGRMQGLVEHLQYLMTFPTTERYVMDDVDLNIYPDEDIETLIDSSNILQAAEKVHKYVRENGYKYAQRGVCLPNYSSRTIDCSSYVTWVLLNAGYRSSRFSEGMYQWTSSTFNSNPEGWEQISSINNAKAGDILVYNGHVEIYAGAVTNGKARVYNCGGNASIQAQETGTSGHTVNQITKILRVPI